MADPVARTRLHQLGISNIRVISSADVVLDDDLVVFAGPNGSGKTSVLESVHLVSTGRSFRSRSVQDIITFGEDSLQVRAHGVDVQGHDMRFGVEKRRDGGARIRLNGQDIARMADLARRLPSLVITPDSQRLLTDASEARRRLVDWLMFHVEPAYHDAHRRFRQTLRQRNSMLRNIARQASVAETWDGELGVAGEQVQALRQRHVTALEQRLTTLLAELCKVPVQIHFQPGWNSDDESFASLLSRCWQRDLARGYTVEGPQRADLVFTVNDRPARDVLSRGESKLLTVAVQVALARLLMEMQGTMPIMLVDELASELDADNRSRFFQALQDTGAQTLVTTVDASLVSGAVASEARIIDVSEGRLSPR